MPLEQNHIANFLKDKNNSNPRHKSELFNLLRDRIEELCEICSKDRIRNVLNPMCYHRFLIGLRLLNGLGIEDQPKFCYNVHKDIVFRDFRNKTVIYKPNDAYLYLIDFFDNFFHGGYRRLNLMFAKKDFKAVKKSFDDRINNRDENFQYQLTDDENFMVFKYDEKIHVIFIKENYALCNATREYVKDLELLFGLCKLFARIYFPEIKLKLIQTNCVEIKTIIPKETLQNISATEPKDEDSKRDKYIWNVFPSELDTLSQFSKEINIYLDKKKNLAIRLHIGIESEGILNRPKRFLLRYRDLRLIFNILYRLYNDFYILHI